MGAPRRAQEQARARRAWWALTIVGVGIIVAVTTFPVGGVGYFAPRCVLAPGVSGVISSAGSAEGALNILLFVPLGLVLSLATRRAVVALSTAAGLALVIEAYQSFTPVHSCTVTDWLLNVFGAACGVVVGVMVLRVTPPG